MCTYYYLHYHHVAPCTRGVEYAVQYSFCSNATLESPSETNPLSPSLSHFHSSSSHSHGHGHPSSSSLSSHSHGYDYGYGNQNQQHYVGGGGGGGQGYNYNYNHNHNYSHGHNHHQHHQQQEELVQQPCDSLSHAPESNYNPSIGLEIDYTNPCATGGCLVSQHCATGGCRLDELGGQWVCCRCGGGGNTFRWCVHPMRKVPDALCYHVVCEGCRMDG